MEKWGDGETMFEEQTMQNIRHRDGSQAAGRRGRMTRGEVTGTEPQMMDAISGHEKNKVERRQVYQIFVNLNCGRQQT